MNADRTETTTTLTLNGNNPAEWQLNTPWYDNLGALFSHLPNLSPAELSAALQEATAAAERQALRPH